jgi:hypothetical protein
MKPSAPAAASHVVLVGSVLLVGVGALQQVPQPQLSPRELSRPSRIARAAVASAATGSSHH